MRNRAFLLLFSLGSEAHDQAQLMSEFHIVQSSWIRRHVSAGHSLSVVMWGTQRKAFCPATNLRTQALSKT